MSVSCHSHFMRLSAPGADQTRACLQRPLWRRELSDPAARTDLFRYLEQRPPGRWLEVAIDLRLETMAYRLQQELAAGFSRRRNAERLHPLRSELIATGSQGAEGAP